MKHQLVLIEWVDSNRAPNGWENKKGMPPLPHAECESVGAILEETDKYITIVQNMNSTQVLGRLSIPKMAIKKIHYLYQKAGK